MTGLAHPLEDVLGGLVETQQPRERRHADHGGWLWMVALVAGIGLLAWFTR